MIRTKSPTSSSIMRVVSSSSCTRYRARLSSTRASNRMSLRRASTSAAIASRATSDTERPSTSATAASRSARAGSSLSTMFLVRVVPVPTDSGSAIVISRYQDVYRQASAVPWTLELCGRWQALANTAPGDDGERSSVLGNRVPRPARKSDHAGTSVPAGREPCGPSAPCRRHAQFARPVTATVTPTPIIAGPPAPRTSSKRRGERANQPRTALAANPQPQSQTAPMATETPASTSI